VRREHLHRSVCRHRARRRRCGCRRAVVRFPQPHLWLGDVPAGNALVQPGLQSVPRLGRLEGLLRVLHCRRRNAGTDDAGCVHFNRVAARGARRRVQYEVGDRLDGRTGTSAVRSKPIAMIHSAARHGLGCMRHFARMPGVAARCGANARVRSDENAIARAASPRAGTSSSACPAPR
jgi:hypothetical protein